MHRDEVAALAAARGVCERAGLHPHLQLLLAQAGQGGELVCEHVGKRAVRCIAQGRCRGVVLSLQRGVVRLGEEAEAGCWEVGDSGLNEQLRRWWACDVGHAVGVLARLLRWLLWLGRC